MAKEGERVTERGAEEKDLKCEKDSTILLTVKMEEGGREPRNVTGF